MRREGMESAKTVRGQGKIIGKRGVVRPCITCVIIRIGPRVMMSVAATAQRIRVGLQTDTKSTDVSNVKTGYGW
jgi:hypothetical protein